MFPRTFSGTNFQESGKRGFSAGAFFIRPLSWLQDPRKSQARAEKKHQGGVVWKLVHNMLQMGTFPGKSVQKCAENPEHADPSDRISTPPLQGAFPSVQKCQLFSNTLSAGQQIIKGIFRIPRKPGDHLKFSKSTNSCVLGTAQARRLQIRPPFSGF